MIDIWATDPLPEHVDNNGYGHGIMKKQWHKQLGDWETQLADVLHATWKFLKKDLPKNRCHGCFLKEFYAGQGHVSQAAQSQKYKT